MDTRDSAVPAIEVRDVTKRFGAVTALDAVGFHVEPSELFFLLGPSGCGKTTMLRILAGLETPDAGTVLFDGRDVADLPPHQRGAPMVFQNYALWPHLTVHANIAFGLVERRVPARERATRVADALRRVGLQTLGSRTPGQLSGGQQQRVVLARALVLNPSVMLLDEPLSNLDARLRANMREELEKLHADTDIAFVYVTHDQTEALSLADRLIVMNEGKIRAAGRPHDLYHRPPNLFCADFLGEANLIEVEIEDTEGETVRVKTPFGPWHAVRSDGATLTRGQTATCLIRPESLVRAGADAGADAASVPCNGLHAEVQAVRLNGSTLTTTLSGAGLSLKATCLNEYPLDLRPGMETHWTVSAANTVLITEP